MSSNQAVQKPTATGTTQPAPTGATQHGNAPVGGTHQGNAAAHAQQPAIDVKKELRELRPFQTDADFKAFDVFTAAAQGLRFRMDRTGGAVNTTFMIIRKKGGILRDAKLVSKINPKDKIITLTNSLTGKEYLTFTLNASGEWDVTNKEKATGAATSNIEGKVKIQQDGDKQTLIWSGANNITYMRLQYKNPVQKVGFCSSRKPANLYRIDLTFLDNAPVFEENPNGDTCKDNLEVNAFIQSRQIQFDERDYVATVALLEIMALQLH